MERLIHVTVHTTQYIGSKKKGGAGRAGLDGNLIHMKEKHAEKVKLNPTLLQVPVSIKPNLTPGPSIN